MKYKYHLIAAAMAFEADRRTEVEKIQALQNTVPRRLAVAQAIGPALRLVPSVVLAAIGRFLLSRSGIRNFIEGAARIELTFKPADGQE